MPAWPRCHALQFLRFGYRQFGEFDPLGDLDEPFGRSRPAFFPTLDLSRACAEPLSAARRFARGFATRSSVGVRIPYGGAGVAQFGPSTANRCPVEFA
jgi:hypothetical protein